MSTHPTPADVLSFWFGELREDGTTAPEVAQRWWRKDDGFDAEIRAKFGALHAAASTDDALVAEWSTTPEGAVAMVIVLDQFSRNLGRNSPTAFANDARAEALMETALAEGHWDALPDLYRYFLLMPAMHAENLAVHKAGKTRFEAAREAARSDATRAALDKACDYLERHTKIIARFGRYPHRNEVLGRTPTPAEVAYLADGGETF